MDNLAIIYDEKFLLHAPQFYHPENPQRITSILNLLKEKSFLNDVQIMPPEIVPDEYILSSHSGEHLSLVRDSIFEGKNFIDSGDTYVVKDSWIAALLSAGSGLTAVDLVADKKAKNVFCLIRPPGHHAGVSTPMGFCLFNNIAIAAQYALQKYKLNRIAIVDWDVHHGNGTQEIFYSTEKVYYISLHQYPFYPGTGSEEERGAGKGFGYTLNFPLPPRTDGKKYLQIFDQYILTELKNFKPQMILISAGFDAHAKDPLADMKLDENDFALMTIKLNEFADKNNIAIISFLEGGYDLNALAKSVFEHLKILKQ